MYALDENRPNFLVVTKTEYWKAAQKHEPSRFIQPILCDDGYIHAKSPAGYIEVSLGQRAPSFAILSRETGEYRAMTQDEFKKFKDWAEDSISKDDWEKYHLSTVLNRRYQAFIDNGQPVTAPNVTYPHFADVRAKDELKRQVRQKSVGTAQPLLITPIMCKEKEKEKVTLHAQLLHGNLTHFMIAFNDGGKNPQFLVKPAGSKDNEIRPMNDAEFDMLCISIEKDLPSIQRQANKAFFDNLRTYFKAFRAKPCRIAGRVIPHRENPSGLHR